jgi:hypothetical protein
MTVKLLPQSQSQSTAANDYVRVSTCCAPFDDTVTLATIERVVCKAATPDTDQPVRVKALVTNLPMTADDAIELAVSYAERKHIEVVLTDR